MKNEFNRFFFPFSQSSSALVKRRGICTWRSYFRKLRRLSSTYRVRYSEVRHVKEFTEESLQSPSFCKDGGGGSCYLQEFFFFSED